MIPEPARRRRKSKTETVGGEPFRPAMLPAWAARPSPQAGEADLAFAAGAALALLDGTVRSSAPWLGLWRRRLALKCAVEAVRLAGRTEDEAALRDAWLLRRAQDDPGPAGHVYGAWRSLTEKGPYLTTAALRVAAERLGIRWSEALGDVPMLIDELGQSGRAAPFAAAEIMRAMLSARGDAEALAWWVADAVIAERMGWSVPVPLLMAERYGAAFRAVGGRGRVRSGDEGFARALCLAIVAAAGEGLRLAGEIGRKAEKLAAVAPVLRAKGADDALQLLLSDDAVPGTLSTAKLSRWATRRLFERLTELEAVRELSGRSQFRIYGL